MSRNHDEEHALAGDRSIAVDEVFTFIDAFEHLSNPGEIARSVARIGSRFGLTSFILTGLPDEAQRLCQSILLDRWPRAWFARYLEANHLPHDPCARYCRASSVPFTWTEIPPKLLAEPRAIQVVNEAGEYGHRAGLCIPLHTIDGFRGLSFAGDRVELPPGARRMLTILAVYACVAAEGACRNTGDQGSVVRLTPREREVLRWIAVGKTVDEIGGILNVSSHTVTEHLKKIRTKLGATNTVHALVKALRTHQLTL
jgi:LuxR family transcriptional regulator, quorum-sensing system regulator BjaR1